MLSVSHALYVSKTDFSAVCFNRCIFRIAQNLVFLTNTFSTSDMRRAGDYLEHASSG